MVCFRSVSFFLIMFSLSTAEVVELMSYLNKVTDFTLDYYEEINFDGLLGLTIAEAQLLEAAKVTTDHQVIIHLEILLEKCKEIRRRIVPILPRNPRKMVILENYLLHPEKWMTDTEFVNNSLEDLGIYKSWTSEDITKNKSAVYKGVPSDHCLMEILAKNCYVSSFCKEMMLAPRIDTGYLLTHRLFYLQIVRLKGCPFNKHKFKQLTKQYCSLILRETRTSDRLGFPFYDIVLEQIVLCGIEGYTEFLNKEWKQRILSWQTPFGCYKGEDTPNRKRSSNVIAYGCADHTTGLGAAALALNLNYELRRK